MGTEAFFPAHPSAAKLIQVLGHSWFLTRKRKSKGLSICDRNPHPTFFQYLTKFNSKEVMSSSSLVISSTHTPVWQNSSMHAWPKYPPYLCSNTLLCIYAVLLHPTQRGPQKNHMYVIKLFTRSVTASSGKDPFHNPVKPDPHGIVHRQ